ncbi:Beta-galactosidase GanA [Alteromonas sp. 38]|nr:Beta-galactosidase GanA [Alteromonas sp. 154]VXB49144.1 Beta-galactosidase GanA [Alteromonas sp. 38]
MLNINFRFSQALVMLTCLMSLVGCMMTSKDPQPSVVSFGQSHEKALSVATNILPKLHIRNGRSVFFVDNKPFLMLCAQTNNSSNYVAALPSVWESVEALGANTLQIPVSWEQIEPIEGEFDFSFLDTLLEQARTRNVRVVPLWFGAFKNTSPSYTPPWVKLDNQRFPRMIRPDGDNHYALSPHSQELFMAERKAFTAFMRHLKKYDRQHTVIMVQVENEVGVYGLVRDHSALANSVFEAPVPPELSKNLGLKNGIWRDAFGKDAEEMFTAYAFARYVGRLAEAGREVLNLPMYTNAALRHPTAKQSPGQYATGGPTFNVLDVWKVGAPAIDMLTPDIYLPKSHDYNAVLDQYARIDNPLFVSETGTHDAYPRYFFEVLGRGAIGFSPFGIDDADYKVHPNDITGFKPDDIEGFAANYALIKNAASEWSRLGFENGIWGAARGDNNGSRHFNLGSWLAEVSFDEWPFGYRAWSASNATGLKQPNEFKNAGVLIAKMDENVFLVTGKNARIEFKKNNETLPNQQAIFVSVEEVEFTDAEWLFQRMWNGDQTDYGINFTDLNKTFRITLGSYNSKSAQRSKPKSY